jgi:hypothetical protein
MDSSAVEREKTPRILIFSYITCYAITIYEFIRRSQRKSRVDSKLYFFFIIFKKYTLPEGIVVVPESYLGSYSSSPIPLHLPFLNSVHVRLLYLRINVGLGRVDLKDHQMRLCFFSLFQLNAANPWGTTFPQYKSQRPWTIHNIVKKVLSL